MKLPDFSSDATWNNLRHSMNAPLINFNPINWTEIDADDILKSLTEGGREVGFPEIYIDPEGTFEYQGYKVLVYIKDQKFYAQGDNEYKYHLCNCKVIEEFKSRDQLNRYVVSRRTDGKFIVNVIDSIRRQYIEKNVIKEMKVCKYCLAQLNYKGYTSYKASPKVYDNFSLEEFFQMYPSSKFQYTPEKYAEDALDNEYTSDFPELSTKYRATKIWKCESCKLDLTADKGYLHVHHKNGIKSDNNFSNLKAVCLGCHAEEPGHQRMKFTQSYIQFMMKYKNPWENLRRNATRQ